MIIAFASLLILVHALAAALGAASATYAEIFYTKATADGKIDSREREYFATTYWGLRWGMTTALVSGLILIALLYMLPTLPDASVYAPLWAQNTLALIVTVTGYAMTRDKIRWWLGSALVFAGWWYMLILDIARPTNFSYTTLMFFYAALAVISAAGWSYARTHARERYEKRHQAGVSQS